MGLPNTVSLRGAGGALGNYGATALNKSNDFGPGIYQPRTISDMLQRSPGGPGGDMNYGYFGPGSALLRKDITGAGNTFVGTDFFTNTFGAKVWDSLNSQTRVFNLIRKVAWGNTTGYRIRSGRNSSTQPVSETGALPSIDSPVLQTVFIQPIFIVTSLGVSALAQFLGTLEGGIGDALAVAQETAMIDHTKRLNQMLTASSNQRVVAGTTANSNVTVVDASWLSVGDVVREAGQSQDITVTVGGLATTLQFNQTTTTDRILYVRSRAGLTAIDDVIDVTGRHINGATFTGSEAAGYGSLDLTTRDPGSWNAGNVFEQGASALRHLTTGLIDQGLNQSRQNGGEPDLLYSGIDQLTRVATVLQANQHFVGEGNFQVKQGGEGTLMGFPTGFNLATYKGIPWFHDFDTATVYQQAANGDAKRGSNVYILDTRFLELPVLFTTQYLESRDYLQNNMLGIKGIFLTALNLRCYDFVKQVKITDLSDGQHLT